MVPSEAILFAVSFEMVVLVAAFEAGALVVFAAVALVDASEDLGRCTMDVVEQ